MRFPQKAWLNVETGSTMSTLYFLLSSTSQSSENQPGYKNKHKVMQPTNFITRKYISANPELYVFRLELNGKKPGSESGLLKNPGFSQSF